MKFLRSLAVVLFFAAVGLLVFYLTALATGEPWQFAWQKRGLRGVILWSYERGSILTLVLMFGLAFACAWMPFNGLLAAISLALFYPLYAIYELVIDTHMGNLLPFEFLGYLVLIVLCVTGYMVGRWLMKRLGPAAS
jgi:hypothetical protein